MAVYAPVALPRGRVGRYFAPAALVGLIAVTAGIVTSAPNFGGHRTAAKRHHTAYHPRHPYWIVRAGDTFAQIAAKNRLTVAQLEAFNPEVAPQTVIPGERLNLWRHPPKPRPKPARPRFWAVRTGQSFGYIAARTGIDIFTLVQLNPGLKPATLQPGDRLRLRR